MQLCIIGVKKMLKYALFLFLIECPFDYAVLVVSEKVGIL